MVNILYGDGRYCAGGYFYDHLHFFHFRYNERIPIDCFGRRRRHTDFIQTLLCARVSYVL